MRKKKLKEDFETKLEYIFLSLNIKWNSNSSSYKKLNLSKTIFEAILQTKDFLFSANRWASFIPLFTEFYWWGITIDGLGLTPLDSPPISGLEVIYQNIQRTFPNPIFDCNFVSHSNFKSNKEVVNAFPKITTNTSSGIKVRRKYISNDKIFLKI